MAHGSEIILIILVYFIIVISVLTMLWRIVVALDNIAKHLGEIGKDLKKRPSGTEEE